MVQLVNSWFTTLGLTNGYLDAKTVVLILCFFTVFEFIGTFVIAMIDNARKITRW